MRDLTGTGHVQSVTETPWDGPTRAEATREPMLPRSPPAYVCRPEHGHTFPLLGTDVRQVEEGQELPLLLEVRAVVHLIGAVAGGQSQSGGRCLPLALDRGRRRASLPQHPPPLPALLRHQLLLLLLGGQAKKLQKL